MKKDLPLLSDLFLSFMKIGLFTFGGGYAMVSIIRNTCVEQKRWITHDEMMDITVIAESTPGPIAINCATYVGYKMASLCGAITATLGIVLPSFVILYVISLFLEQFLTFTLIAKAFQGIKIGVSLLILDAGIGMLQKTAKSKQACCIAVISFLAMLVINLFALKISSVVLLFLAGIISVAVFAIKANHDRGGSHDLS